MAENLASGDCTNATFVHNNNNNNIVLLDENAFGWWETDVVLEPESDEAIPIILRVKNFGRKILSMLR